MLGIVLMTVLNVTLYLGMIKGIDNALNLAEFTMWVMAILSAFTMFIGNQELLKSPEKHFLYRWMLRILIIASVTHSVYWGYFFAPTVLLVSAVVLWVRKYELDNRKIY